jgi:hypothetical protein
VLSDSADEQGGAEEIMDQVELLTALIEPSIALLGFSGLVAALGRRSSGEWSPVEKLRLINLLAMGVTVLACALLALTLLSAGLSQTAVCPLSSVAWVVLVLPFAVWTFSRTLRMPEYRTASRAFLNVVIAVVAATAAIQVANAIFLQEFWPFFLGLAVLLIIGVTQFFRLLWFGLFR